LSLVVYLISHDWVIAAFCLLIFFPIARLVSSSIHKRLSRNAVLRAKRDNAEYTYSSLSGGEKSVIDEFVNAGGCVLTWGQMNRTQVSRSAIESLIQRNVLSTSVTADGMRETFVLDTALFDVGTRAAKLPAHRAVHPRRQFEDQ
jgi:hypothetical protein